MKYDTATPYAVSMVILKKDGKAAFLMRSNTSYKNGYYGLAAGKVENDESFIDAAVREVQEETGVSVKPENLRQLLTCHLKEPDEDTSWVEIIFEASEWEGEVVNAEPHKHSEVTWLDLNNLPENVIPALRFMLDQIAAGKNYCEYGWGS